MCPSLSTCLVFLVLVSRVFTFHRKRRKADRAKNQKKRKSKSEKKPLSCHVDFWHKRFGDHCTDNLSCQCLRIEKHFYFFTPNLLYHVRILKAFMFYDNLWRRSTYFFFLLQKWQNVCTVCGMQQERSTVSYKSVYNLDILFSSSHLEIFSLFL